MTDPRRPLLLALILFALAATAAVKSVKVDEPKVTLKRGSATIASLPTLELCRERKAALIAADGRARVSGTAVYDCIYAERTRLAFAANPPPAPTCTAPKPAQEAQVAQCPAGSVGTWSQTRDYVPAAYPTCWSPGEWLPAEAPAGICATPQTLVYACSDTGADGRILESATIQWPSCASVSYQPPSLALVVATNDGTRPLYWRLASKVTDARLWTQTGGVGSWVRATSIDWGTLGSVTLSWTPPTLNADGSQLDDLAGYRIQYGTSASALTWSVDISSPGVRSYIVDQLSPATWYFGVRAVNAAGQESDLSAVASKTVP